MTAEDDFADHRAAIRQRERVSTLHEFLAARLDEDEAAVRQSAKFTIPRPNGYGVGVGGSLLADPARVLATIAAHRAILADAAEVPTTSMRHVLRLLAQIYRDHPDCPEELR